MTVRDLMIWQFSRVHSFFQLCNLILKISVKVNFDKYYIKVKTKSFARSCDKMESETVKEAIQSAEDVADRLIAKIRPHARTLAKVVALQFSILINFTRWALSLLMVKQFCQFAYMATDSLWLCYTYSHGIVMVKYKFNSQIRSNITQVVMKLGLLFWLWQFW